MARRACSRSGSSATGELRIEFVEEDGWRLAECPFSSRPHERPCGHPRIHHLTRKGPDATRFTCRENDLCPPTENFLSPRKNQMRLRTILDEAALESLGVDLAHEDVARESHPALDA